MKKKKELLGNIPEPVPKLQVDALLFWPLVSFCKYSLCQMKVLYLHNYQTTSVGTYLLALIPT